MKIYCSRLDKSDEQREQAKTIIHIFFPQSFQRFNESARERCWWLIHIQCRLSGPFSLYDGTGMCTHPAACHMACEYLFFSFSDFSSAAQSSWSSFRLLPAFLFFHIFYLFSFFIISGLFASALSVNAFNMPREGVDFVQWHCRSALQHRNVRRDDMKII